MRLTIYMKSGNKITIAGVKDYTIQNMGNEIVSLKLDYGWWRTGPKLLVKTIDLSQIEAVTMQ